MAKIELCQFRTCTKPHDMPVRLRDKKVMLCRWHAKEAKELREREEQKNRIILTDSWR